MLLLLVFQICTLVILRLVPSSSSLSSTFICSNHNTLPDPLPSDSIAVLLDFVPSIVTNSTVEDQPLKISSRVHKPPMYLQDYACNSASALSRASTGSHPPRSRYGLSACLTYFHLDPQYKSYLMTANQLRFKVEARQKLDTYRICRDYKIQNIARNVLFYKGYLFMGLYNPYWTRKAQGLYKPIWNRRAL